MYPRKKLLILSAERFEMFRFRQWKHVAVLGMNVHKNTWVQQVVCAARSGMIPARDRPLTRSSAPRRASTGALYVVFDYAKR